MTFDHELHLGIVAESGRRFADFCFLFSTFFRRRPGEQPNVNLVNLTLTFVLIFLEARGDPKDSWPADCQARMPLSGHAGPTKRLTSPTSWCLTPPNGVANASRPKKPGKQAGANALTGKNTPQRLERSPPMWRLSIDLTKSGPFLHHFSRFRPAVPFVFKGFAQNVYAVRAI